MRAMLLCAGLGERLRPLTRTLPKPALPLLGRPFAVQRVRWLALHGIDTVVVNLHHHPDAVRAAIGDPERFGLRRLQYTMEPDLLGTGGGVRNAAGHLRGDGPFLVVNSDFLADIDVEAAFETHRRSGCAATLVLADRRSGYSTVDVDTEGRVISIAGAPPAEPSRVASHGLFTGLQILEEELLDRLPVEGPSDIVRHLHRDLAAEGRLGSYRHSGFWWEFGTCTMYLEGSLRLLELPADLLGRIAATGDLRRIGGATVVVGPGADFHNAVDLRGRVVLGSDCSVGEGTSVEDSVVMPGARIGPGCRLRRVIVGPGAVLDPGLELENVAVSDDDDPGTPVSAEIRRAGGLLIRDLDR